MKTLSQKRVQFAKFCINEKLDPTDADKLIQLAQKAIRAGVKNANEGTGKTEKAKDQAMNTLEQFAKELGFRVKWNGIYPNVMKGRFEVYLPS